MTITAGFGFEVETWHCVLANIRVKWALFIPLFNIRKCRQWLCEQERGWQGQPCDDWFTDLCFLQWLQGHWDLQSNGLWHFSKSLPKLMTGGKNEATTSEESAWPHAVVHYRDAALSVFIITPNKDMHVTVSRQKVVKDDIWRMDLIDRQYMVHGV